MSDLTTALAARTAASRRHQEASQALDRARTTAVAAEAEADRLAGDEARWVQRHARKLEQWIAAGSHGPQPVATADAAAVQRQASAKATATAAKQALAGFTSAEREAQLALTGAETAVRAAALGVLSQEADELAGQVLAHEAAAEAGRARLHAVKLIRDFQPSVRVYDALRDAINTPIPLLRDRGAIATPVNVLRSTGDIAVSEDAAHDWRQRLDALLAGEVEQPPPQEVAA